MFLVTSCTDSLLWKIKVVTVTAYYILHL